MHFAESYVAGLTISPPGQLKRCPIENTTKLISKKFTVLILRDMIYKNQKHFNEFLRSIEGINPNTLSTRLQEMERNKLIQRRVYHNTPVNIEYSLTEKGKELLPILDQMAAFSMKHSPEIFRNGKSSCFQEVTGRNPTSF